MGLFKYLKEKFSRKSKEEEVKKVDTVESFDDAKEEANTEIYEKGMEKSRKEFADKLKVLSKKYRKVNDEYFTELEEILIEADVGVSLALSVIQELLLTAKKDKINDADELNEKLIDLLFAKYLKENEVLRTDFTFEEGKTTVGLIVGVNGVGKTTTIAKLAYRYMNMNKKVLLVAGDTFRAGAVDQLAIWAERLNCDIIVGKENQDPASVIFDACKSAEDKKYDLILVDTAGRLQTKANLMNELVKINKVINKALPNSLIERLLVLDATTGQNGVSQAKAFFEATSLDGIIITKMDGTSKGGIILSIKTELDIPVRFIGFGEKMTDLREFNLEQYLYSLCVPSEEK